MQKDQLKECMRSIDQICKTILSLDREDEEVVQTIQMLRTAKLGLVDTIAKCSVPAVSTADNGSALSIGQLVLAPRILGKLCYYDVALLSGYETEDGFCITADDSQVTNVIWLRSHSLHEVDSTGSKFHISQIRNGGSDALTSQREALSNLRGGAEVLARISQSG